MIDELGYQLYRKNKKSVAVKIYVGEYDIASTSIIVIVSLK